MKNYIKDGQLRFLEEINHKKISKIYTYNMDDKIIFVFS